MIVLDGALGTLLEAQGIATPAPRWSAAALDTHPDAVAAIHAAYAAAGATVHTAATFRTTPRAVGDDADRLTALAVALARGAVPAAHEVVGSLAPVEDCWHPERSPADAAAHHAATAARLVRHGVDRVLVETFAHVGEALAATEAAAATGVPVWTALSPGPFGALLTPEALHDAVPRVRDAGAEVVLVNCLPARRATPWVEALADAGGRWGVYANAGDPDDGLTYGTPGSGEAYGRLAAAWAARGAEILGGCCGTGPVHIAAIAKLTTG